MKLILLVFMVLAGAAKADIAHQVCYEEIGECIVLYRYGEDVVKVALPRPLYDQTTAPERLSLVKAGLNIVPLSAGMMTRFQPYLTTETRSVVADYGSVVSGGSLCGFEVALCGLSAFGMTATYGAAYFIAKFTCAAAGIQCATAYDDYKEWQKKAEAAKRAEDAPNDLESARPGRDGPSIGSDGFIIGSPRRNCYTEIHMVEDSEERIVHQVVPCP